MKGDAKVIQHLNKVLFNELTAINQYFLHARMFENWGLRKLQEVEYKESIDEMKHADRLIKRILFLDGLPNLQALARLRIGENVEEILRADMEAELEGAKLYRDIISHCEKVRDYVTRDLAREILEDEEGHIDFLETQFELIKSMGIQNYIQLQSEGAKE